jgi:2-keto-4-pentenoate hydratase/2-oxohepta-3-ene-1,7-dioic acid hydratase in catechol pathway
VEIGAVYTIGLNYRDASTTREDDQRPERPLVFGKASSSVTGHGSAISWDRSLSTSVNGECELGVVLGEQASVLGYTIVNDVTSQDPWLDGDQWLLGKSFPGFCPVGPWLVLAGELDPRDLALKHTVNGVVIQEGRTSQMRFSIEEIIDYLGAHILLQPGDLISTGTPARIGPDAGRHLHAGDRMSCWIEGIGELTNSIE